MKQRGKTIGLASVYMIVAQLLCLLVAYISTKAPDGIAGVCLYLYLFAIIPVYFVVRGFAKNKVLFWFVSLGCYALLSALTYWLIITLDQHYFFTGWDAFAYLACWLYMVCFIGGALLLDLIVLAIKKIAQKCKRWVNASEGDVQ